MKSLRFLFLATAALFVVSCGVDPVDSESANQDEVTAPATQVQSTEEAAVVGGPVTNTEYIYWRCPGSTINYTTSALCAASCTGSCYPILVCKDSRGRPILCP